VQTSIAEGVRKFIEDSFMFRDDGEPLPDDTSLLEAGLIDSTGVLELVAFLEEKYSIDIADADIIPENLDSIRSIAAFVAGKVAKADAAA
jgi:acyl carrier protein